jgi:hypothetical protein
MQHRAVTEFWREYGALPAGNPQSAEMKANARHPSLQFKKAGERLGQEIRSARVTLNYRAIAIKRSDG